MKNDIYSDFAARHRLGKDVSIEEIELLMESEARREEAYDRVLAEQNIITPLTDK